MRVSNFVSTLLKLSKSSRVILTSLLIVLTSCLAIDCRHQDRSQSTNVVPIVITAYEKEALKKQDSNNTLKTFDRDFGPAVQAEFVREEHRMDGRYKRYRLPDGSIIVCGPISD